MKKVNIIVVFSENLKEVLFCIRAKDPYKGLYNFVGGKVEENESNDEAAYRELFEETGISKEDIELEHFMDLNYFKYESNLQVYYGVLKHEVNLVEEKNKLEWVVIDDKLLDIKKFAGNYNIPHIIKQIEVYMENETNKIKTDNINNKYKIITLCGSIKFKDEFMKIQEKLVLEGKIVFLPIFFYNKNIEINSETKEMLNKIHKQKIDMSDEIYVINLNGYIGESTESEIEYAKIKNKKISYLESIK